MKKTTLVILLAAILFGCKKNSSGGGPTQYALSKIFENGKLGTEYVFNGTGQLTEVKYYKQEMGATVLYYVEKLSYDKEGNLKESISYAMPANKVDGIGKFILDGSGQLSRQSYAYGAGSDSGEIYLHIDYKFKEGKIVKQTWKTPDEKTTNYRDFSYYDDGNLKSVDAFNVSGLTQEKYYSHHYSASDATRPATLTRPIAYPVNYYLEYMFTTKVETFSYENDLVDNHREFLMSEKQYDARGFVTKQKLTTKKIAPAGADEVTVLAFDWKKL